MSISSEISRLQALRNKLRAKLVAMLGMSSGATLGELVDAVDAMADNGAATGTIKAKDGTYAIAEGYHNGAGLVSIDSAEREKLTADNIREGVSILGVTGTCATAESVKIQPAKSVTPTKSAQAIAPDTGFHALAGVTVGAIPDAYQNVTGVTAAAGDVLAGKIIVGAGGEEIAGTMVNNGAVSAAIDGMTQTAYTVPAGYHSGGGKVTLDDTIERALAAI